MHPTKTLGYALALLLALATGQLLEAEVKMPAIFGDHMVLQQESMLPVWGTAEAGEKVTVTVGVEKADTVADSNGKWTVKLPPLPNGAPPVTMTVAGKNTLTFTDVLVGDVWVCSGQSNMELPLAQSHIGAREVPKAHDPQLRLFCFHHQTALQPLFGSTGPNLPEFVFSNSMPLPAYSGWVVCTPDTAKTFSAVGYFFGRELRTSLNRPIGLVKSAWGGTPAEAWISLGGLQKEPALQHYLDGYRANLAAYPSLAKGYPERLAAYQAERSRMLLEDMPPYNAGMKAWIQADKQAKAAGQPSPPKPVRPAGPIEPKDPNGGKNGPANLFNGMITPLIPYAIKGVIWYQGESNSRNGVEYRTLFGRMITEWREVWGAGNFPFIFVQLASFDAGPNATWPYVRESQLKTLALPNTGMASAVDLGDFKNLTNIHPSDKLDVGLRLALAAEHVAYGRNVVCSGPIYDSSKVEKNAIRVNFTQTGGGLVIGSPPWIDPTVLSSWTTDRLVGFEIAGIDRNYVPAVAKIDGSSVVVSSPKVAAPVFVRFAWSNVVWANLYNKEGLPASPFRTDDWAPPPLVHVAPVNPTTAASTNASPATGDNQ